LRNSRHGLTDARVKKVKKDMNFWVMGFALLSFAMFVEFVCPTPLDQ
jgi:hypothetical protein